jgi:hypothetical protein
MAGTNDPEIMNAIKNILALTPRIQELRKQLRDLENTQSQHRNLLKDRYGNNTIIHTNVGSISIKERYSDGKLSLEDIRDIFDTIDWIGTETKDRLFKILDDECEGKRKYSKTLTVRKPRRKNKKTIKRKTKQDDLKDSVSE